MSNALLDIINGLFDGFIRLYNTFQQGSRRKVVEATCHTFVAVAFIPFIFMVNLEAYYAVQHGQSVV
jgi:hypothetical protein